MMDPLILDAWAEHLRALGWVVVAPVDPKAAVPAVAVGQVWVSPRQAVSARSIVRLGPCDGFRDLNCVDFTVDTPDHAEPKRLCDDTLGWNAWVRRTNARPLPTPTDGAT